MTFDITDYTQPLILIFVGLPGTGKTTFAKYCFDCLKSKNREKELYIITRDKIRCHLLNNPPNDPNWKKNLDEFVDRVELFYLTAAMFVHYFNYKTIILDGCHTNYEKLKTLLEKLNEMNYGEKGYRAYKIQIMLFGNQNTTCGYKISDKDEGDYTDYDLQTYEHSTIPQKVIERKRAELKELYEHMDTIKSLVDQVCECDVK